MNTDSSNKSTCILNILPEELWFNICRYYLETEDTIVFYVTCKQIYNLRDKILDWENLCKTYLRGVTTANNWREYFLVNRAQYYHTLKVYDKSQLELIAGKPIYVLVLGARNAGKTSLVDKIAPKAPVHGLEANLEDSVQTQINVEHYTFKLDIVDTITYFVDALDANFRYAQVFLILYDTTSEDSFKEAEKFYQLTKDKKEETQGKEKYLTVIFIGTKIDRREERKITSARGREMARRNQAAFCEISVVEEINLDYICQEIVWMYARKQYAKSKSGKKPNTSSNITAKKDKKNKENCDVQ